MTGSLIHFGVDPSFRLSVLRSAGFEVAECHSLGELPYAFSTLPDAVLVAEEPGTVSAQAISLTRAKSTAPVILFAANPCTQLAEVDLLISTLTDPLSWLEEIRALIAHSQKIMAQSRLIQRRSATLVLDSAAVIEQSREGLARSAEQRREMDRNFDLREWFRQVNR